MTNAEKAKKWRELGPIALEKVPHEAGKFDLFELVRNLLDALDEDEKLSPFGRACQQLFILSVHPSEMFREWALSEAANEIESFNGAGELVLQLNIDNPIRKWDDENCTDLDDALKLLVAEGGDDDEG